MTDSTNDHEQPGAVFVMGNGHSGSTLLEMLLLDDTRIVGLVELGQTLAAAFEEGPAAHLLGRTCLCGAEVAEYPLWSTVTPAMDGRWHSGTLDLQSAYTMVIDAARSLHPDAVIVESSKNVPYLRCLESAIDRPVEVVQHGA